MKSRKKKNVCPDQLWLNITPTNSSLCFILNKLAIGYPREERGPSVRPTWIGDVT